MNRFVASLSAVPGTTLQYAPGHPVRNNPVDTVVSSTPAQLRSFYSSYRYNVVPTTDNDPYFWHFARFGTVLRDFLHPITSSDREYQVGERVLVLLFALAVVISAVFLLLPFVADPIDVATAAAARGARRSSSPRSASGSCSSRSR